MFTPPHNAHALSPFRRVVAALGIGLIVLLGIASVSPLAHAHLHAGDAHAATTPHACAVVLFAGGATLALATIAVHAPRAAWHEFVATPPAKLFLPAPRYLRQPERGPPAA